jgi:hypothetical protein
MPKQAKSCNSHATFRASGSLFEALESRQLMSVSLDSAGFTQVTPSYDSRIIYVSSKGSDYNSGLTSAAPIKSFAKAQSLARSGMPDQILLHRGDIFNDSFGYWKKSGRSGSEPMVIGAYGDGDRPEIRTGNSSGITIGNVANKTIDNLYILGLNWRASARDTSIGGYNSSSAAVGISVVSATHNLVIEDNTMTKYRVGMSFVPVYGSSQGTLVRRNIVTNSYTTGGSNAEGLYAERVIGMTLEQNTFDHNGWLDGVYAARPTTRNHNVYITGDSSGLVARENVFSNAGSHGIQARCGGIIENNLFLNDPIGLSFGVVNGAGTTTKGGVSGRVTGNVFLGSRDIAGQGRGLCIESGNIRAGGNTVFSDNVMSTYTAGQLWAIQIGYGQGTTQYDGVGVNDLTVSNNIVYKWYKGFFTQYGLSPYASGYQHLGNVTLRGNKFVDITKTVYINSQDVNIYDGNEGAATAMVSSGVWSDPDRSVASYMAAIGGTRSLATFLQKTDTRAGDTWDSRYSALPVINYIRDGFGLDPEISSSIAALRKR